MNLRLKDPTKVYYCKEQKLSFAGDKTIEGVKVTQHVRQLLNEGALVEVREEEISKETKAKIIAEAKEEARVAKLTPAELKKEKAEAVDKAKEIEKA